MADEIVADAFGVAEPDAMLPVDVYTAPESVCVNGGWRRRYRVICVVGGWDRDIWGWNSGEVDGDDGHGGLTIGAHDRRGNDAECAFCVKVSMY